MWELDHKESWPLKNWRFLNCGLEKTLESPLNSKEIKPVNTKRNQSWVFIGRTDVEAEAPILWPPDVKSQLTGKDPDAGKDWRQEERGMTEDKIVGWHHWFNGHEQILGDGEGQGSLVYCSPWGCKESDTTERLNWTDVWMWELDHKESWPLKNWCFWTVVLEKTLESPLDRKEIQPVHPKGDQSWIFIGRTDAEAEAPILWPPDGKSWLTRKDTDAGKD